MSHFASREESVLKRPARSSRGGEAKDAAPEARTAGELKRLLEAMMWRMRSMSSTLMVCPFGTAGFG